MTVVMDCSDEALIEVREMLRERVRRMNECVITSSAIAEFLVERFGGNRSSVRDLLQYILGFFVGSGVLVLWDTKATRTRPMTIYTVNGDALSNT